MHAELEEFQEQRLYFFGFWEAEVTRLFSDTLQPGDHAVDVGANLGYFTLLSSTLVGERGKVVSIEASPYNFSRLQRNLELNGIENVQALNIGAWDREDTLTLTTDEQGSGTATLAESETDSARRSEQIPVAPLDSVLELDLEKLRLIKIDVEGAESHAISGLTRTLRSARRVKVICEIDPGAISKLGSSVDQLCDRMKALGFDHWSLVPNDISPESFCRGQVQKVALQEIHEVPKRPSYVLFERKGSL